MNPRFPVYIVSKGRWKRRPTVNFFEKSNIPYKIIIEEDEYSEYSKYINKEKILILPKRFKEEYDTFWEIDDGKTGPGPARNFAWEHSIENGFDWHWVLDDNIESIMRFNKNMKIKMTDGTGFYVIEDFVLRYKNIGEAGMNYAYFCPANESRPPFNVNKRIYSCILLKNNLSFRWRGRYNEDTDLSLRILKSGLCTVLFNAFLAEKRATQTIYGGNTEEFYKEEGTYLKSKMIVDMHPDIAKISYRFNRPHHYINYNKFKQWLERNDDFNYKNKINNFGLKLKKVN